MSNLMKQQEVADYLGITVKTLAQWRWSKEQNLPYAKFGGSIRYRREDVEAFVENSLKQGRSEVALQK